MAPEEQHKAADDRQGKESFRFYCMVVMAMTVVLGSSVTAFAAGDPLTVVNNLSDFIFGLVRLSE